MDTETPTTDHRPRTTDHALPCPTGCGLGSRFIRGDHERQPNGLQEFERSSGCGTKLARVVEHLKTRPTSVSTVPSFELDGRGVVGNFCWAGRRRGTWPVEEGNGEVNQGDQEQSGQQHPVRSSEPQPPVASVSLFARLGHDLRHGQFIRPGRVSDNNELLD